MTGATDTSPLRRLRPPGILVLVGAVYLFAFPYHPGLRSPNELCRLWQSRALVEHGTIELTQALRTWGYVGDLSVKDGRYFPSKAPLLSFLAAPIYAVLRALGGGGPHAASELAQVFWSRLWLTVLPTLGLLALIRRFLRAYVSSPVADAVTAAYGLGSLAFSYSLLFMSHQATAVLLFGAFFALWRVGRGEWRARGYLVAGAAAGAAIAAEYTAALGVAGVVLFAALQELGGSGSLQERLTRLARHAGLATAGAMPFILFLGWYHHAAFGHPLHSGYKYLADAAYQPWHLGGFLGIRYPDPRAFVLSFFSPLRGLFALAPFLLVGVAGVRRLFGAPSRRIGWMTVALLAGYGYFTSSFSYESWGWTTGPRHMTGLVPFLLLPAALFIESLRDEKTLERRLGLGVCAGACAASILVTGPVTLVNYIPDSVSSPLFGLALPLFGDGYLPPSALAALGLSGPWPGALLLLALAAAAGWAAWLIVRPEASPRAALLPSAGALLTAALALGLLAAATRDDDADRGAQGHLRSVWITPPPPG